ncbi:MAG: hydrogenase maturation protease [Aggregatilineales bacterium]
MLRGDDAVGPLAARRLAARLADQPVKIIEAHQLLPEMAWLLSQAQFVVLIDAAVGAAAGVVQWQPLERAEERTSMAFGVVGHHLTCQQLLAVCQTLYGVLPEVLLITVAGETFEVGEELSEAVQQALPGLIDQVERVVWQRLSGEPVKTANSGRTTSAPGALCQPDS